MNDYLISSIVLFVSGIICSIIMFGLVFKKPRSDKIEHFVSGTLELGKLSAILPKSGLGMVGLLICLLFVFGIITAGIGGSRTTSGNNTPIGETVTVTDPTENFGSGTSTFKSIGHGPAIDKLKIKNWLNGSLGDSVDSNGNILWPDGNGELIKIPKDHFKSLYGFIPPSISYYPTGQNNTYNMTNYKSGRENCMKACALTDCTAVQTEVPENCYQQRSNEYVKNDCGINPEFSCTLFYKDTKKADDAYWSLSQRFPSVTSRGCFEETGSSCLGKKYYEDNVIPVTLPSGAKPSLSKVKYCDETITKTNAAGYGVVSGTCTCTSSSTNCSDEKCCIMRPLLTTEFLQNKHPYYSLPINIAKAEGKSANYTMLVPTINYKNGNSKACGYVGDKLVSCTENNACTSNSTNENCWKVNTSLCSGDTFLSSSPDAKNAMSAYKSKYSEGNGDNYDDLYKSCFYRQKLTTVEPIQFNCGNSTVTRGCWGSPPIIYTSALTENEGFAACSDTSVIPNSERCQNSGNLAACEGFPYSCGTAGGTNTLWTKNY